MVCMPGGRAGSSEAQPISCHIDEVLVVLLLRDAGELVSITQFGILDDEFDNVIPLLVLLLLLEFPLPTTFCTELF